MLYFRYCLLVLVGLSSWLGKSWGQEYTIFPREEYYQSEQQQRSFSNEQWLQTIEGIDYSETVRAERQEDENFFTDSDNRNRQQRQLDNQSSSSSAIWATILKFLFLAMGIFVVAIIITRFLGPEGLGKPRSKRIANDQLKIDLQNIEENIHESDLHQYIGQALSQSNYNLAIRLYYLAIIKELSLSKMIRWKRDKTNRDYWRELKAWEGQKEFSALTKIYERIWYGNAFLQERDFQMLRPRFEQMIAKAKTAQPNIASETYE